MAILKDTSEIPHGRRSAICIMPQNIISVYTSKQQKPNQGLKIAIRTSDQVKQVIFKQRNVWMFEMFSKRQSIFDSLVFYVEVFLFL